MVVGQLSKNRWVGLKPPRLGARRWVGDIGSALISVDQVCADLIDLEQGCWAKDQVRPSD